ncbi:MAG: hypothetical protein ACRCZF_04230, partial [Gemmataceae bacterium]
MTTTRPTTSPLRDLLRTPIELVGELDIAERNLRCAEALPGADGLDVAGVLARLDEWAEVVCRATADNLHKFQSFPAHFDHSEPLWRMVALTMTLKDEFGIRYDPTLVRNMDWRDSRHTFLHGLLCENRAGTCPSLPALVVAVGRRLGYPLFLVRAPAHLFCRWDDPATSVRFNVEYNGTGMTDHPDEYYRRWPTEWPAGLIEVEAELPRGRESYLRSLTPAEETAEFLGLRGHCLEDNGRLSEAVAAYHWAMHFDPVYPGYRGFFRRACDNLVTASGRVPGDPSIRI